MRMQVFSSSSQGKTSSGLQKNSSQQQFSTQCDKFLVDIDNKHFLMEDMSTSLNRKNTSVINNGTILLSASLHNTRALQWNVNHWLQSLTVCQIHDSQGPLTRLFQWTHGSGGAEVSMTASSLTYCMLVSSATQWIKNIFIVASKYHQNKPNKFRIDFFLLFLQITYLLQRQFSQLKSKKHFRYPNYFFFHLIKHE